MWLLDDMLYSSWLNTVIVTTLLMFIPPETQAELIVTMLPARLCVNVHPASGANDFSSSASVIARSVSAHVFWGAPEALPSADMV